MEHSMSRAMYLMFGLLMLILQCEGDTEVGDYIVDCSACNYLPLKGISSYSCKVTCDIQGEANVNLTSLYDIVREMSQQLKTVTNELEETKKELEDTRKKVNATEKKLNTDVVFSARLSGQPTLSPGEKVILDYVISNVGNAYDNNTGIFTVPYNGSYELILTTMGTSAGIATDLMGPEGRLCQAYAKESLIIGMCTTRKNLVAGDQIFVEARSNVAVVYHLSYNTFSGHLIHLD